MKIQMLAGAACAALMGLAVPAFGASPTLAPQSAAAVATVQSSVDSYYARRAGTLIWLADGPRSPAASSLLEVLRRAPLDGLTAGPALAAEAQALMSRAAGGDRAALASADRFLSAAWVTYVQNLQSAPSGMAIADGWAAPRRQSPQQILLETASARSVADHVRQVSGVNPIYAQLRDAAWQQTQADGATDSRIRANLDRVRTMPFQDRYVMVDAGSARLWMVQDGRIVDSMKVIVGKPTSPTPMVASTIYYATLNPYWNVPQDLVQKLIAPRVVDQGVAYLKSHNYEVLSGYGSDAEPIDASTVDWHAVVAGTEVVKVRQKPGPANSMGRVKFGFPNSSDIYLHDTPRKELFAEASRDVSNGCIRLEDAERLSRWLLGREPNAASTQPEQHVLLPKPVPIYVTYLTTQTDNSGQLTYLDDAYGKDAGAAVSVASLQ